MQFIRASMLIPRGFVANDAVNDLDGTLISMRPIGATSLCPACGAISGRIHSRYSRRLADLPIAGRRVRLVLLARRFRRGAVLCGRRIFNERFDADVLAPWARRTARLDYIVHHLALALGGRPAASSPVV
jgi:zinc-finger of transposase IS204/IS1001/IS1096/IS1165